MLDGENFDEFDKSKLHRQNFSISASTCNIYGSHENTYLSWLTSLSARSDEAMMSLPKYIKLRVDFSWYIYREQSDKIYNGTWPSTFGLTAPYM